MIEVLLIIIIIVLWNGFSVISEWLNEIRTELRKLNNENKPPNNK